MGWLHHMSDFHAGSHVGVLEKNNKKSLLPPKAWSGGDCCHCCLGRGWARGPLPSGKVVRGVSKIKEKKTYLSVVMCWHQYANAGAGAAIIHLGWKWGVVVQERLGVAIVVGQGWEWETAVLVRKRRGKGGRCCHRCHCHRSKLG